MVTIQKENDGKLRVCFPYSPERVEKIKTVSGKAWVPEGKYWTVPETESAVIQLTELFKGERVEIDPELELRMSKGTRLIIWKTLKRN